ncbi:MAG: DUF86 domain-containing protein [Candidatus Aenigmarchaeota archaeon]|nr:DUF86 domain-containing protein [Candidatus Aenigmarchaeota archaeon]
MDELRILEKIDELESYNKELRGVIPKSLEFYMNTKQTRRICERLLQISIECIIDICSLLTKELKLGAPSDEDDMFDKLKDKKIISTDMANKLKTMKGFRNILVHRYSEVDDELVYNFLKNDIEDFASFKNKILVFLRPKKR